MNTPIADFIDRYIESKTSRFHMPGHKGAGEIEKYDITEIAGADVLYSAEGIIAESENNATELFGTAHTYYSTEGTTLAIKAMLAIASKGKIGTVLAARNVHKAFIYGCALLDLDVEWLYPKEYSHLCSCIITASEVDEKLSQMCAKPCAVYITSPDYLGNISDIKGISQICKKHGVPLLVDNAHGAYFKFLTPSLHPIDLGAAMCADSAHKTLPVLTGGAYLHISRDFPELFRIARSSLSLFASTSPSYLIMRSLDKCNKYLAESFKDELKNTTRRVELTKGKISKIGFSVEACEPLKIVINAAKAGYTGGELADILRKCGIECEFCDCEYLVLMVTPKNRENDLEKLISAFESITPRSPLVMDDVKPTEAKSAMRIRAAVLSESETVAAKAAVGRICASPSVSCPPAVPIAISGEVIGLEEVKLFEHYCIDSVEVVK